MSEKKESETNHYIENKADETNDCVENKDVETNHCDKDPLICAIDEITEKMAQLKICDTNDYTKDAVDGMTEEDKLLLQRGYIIYKLLELINVSGPIIDLVEVFFPSLIKESIYWAPETYWDKMMEKTGINLDEAMCLYELIQEEKDENIKNVLKRKLTSLFIKAYKKH